MEILGALISQLNSVQHMPLPPVYVLISQCSHKLIFNYEPEVPFSFIQRSTILQGIKKENDFVVGNNYIVKVRNILTPSLQGMY